MAFGHGGGGWHGGGHEGGHWGGFRPFGGLHWGGGFLGGMFAESALAGLLANLFGFAQPAQAEPSPGPQAAGDQSGPAAPSPPPEQVVTVVPPVVHYFHHIHHAVREAVHPQAHHMVTAQQDHGAPVTPAPTASAPPTHSGPQRTA